MSTYVCQLGFGQSPLSFNLYLVNITLFHMSNIVVEQFILNVELVKKCFGHQKDWMQDCIVPYVCYLIDFCSKTNYNRFIMVH